MTVPGRERADETRDLLLLAAVLRDSNDAVTLLDLQGHILGWNRGAERMYGYSEAEALGMSAEVLAPDENRSQVRELLRALVAGADVPSLEVRRLTKSGQVLDVWVTVTRLVDERGVPTAVAITERDVTERKRAEAERENMVRELARAVKLREEILAMVSHDIRNPLAAILLAAQALKRRSDVTADEFSRRQLDLIERAAARARRLAQDLLDVARIEAGRLPLDLLPVDLRALIAESVELHQPLADERSVELRQDVEAAAGSVVCDRDRVLQVLENIIGNALKFCRAGGVVSVRASMEGGEASVSISDQGPGIPAAQVSRVFERYWSGATGSRDGVGLGLYITRGIVEAHGGTLRVDTREGEGSTFTFTLPLRH